MKNLIEEDYEALSRRVCDCLLDTVRKDQSAVIVLPTGESPRGAYRLFVKAVKEEGLLLDGVTFIQLDEWAGIGQENPAGCGYYLKKELFEPLGISPSQWIAFRGEAQNLEEECRRVEGMLEKMGKINLALLGVGKNGHIGLNEPGDSWQILAHPVRLTPKTLTHSMLAGEKVKPAWGLTLGIGTFFRTQQILLIASGPGKEEVISFFLEDKVSPQYPVSILKLHSNAVCIVEKELYQKAQTKDSHIVNAE